ncbi:lipopolysaccharide biosynthesis protein [Treponema phagedenis]|uniref:lipopolysaccharide biosynthesis protein n=1 Tax=Treponema phagedenis TaxID=162 RepID=UPI0020913A93|nr:polysaccharide biosynthesis C-terminal domain-containing protein [Treponema phagedenis]
MIQMCPVASENKNKEKNNLSDLKKLIKSSGIYFVGSVLSKTILFFMLPIFTRYLNPTEYGEYNLSQAYIVFFTLFFFFDIWVGIMRFILDKKNKVVENYKEKIIFSGFIIFTISSILYIIFFYIFMQIYGVKFKFLLMLTGLCTNLQTTYGYMCRAYEKNFIFALSGIINTVIYAIVASSLLIFFKFSYEALFIGITIGNLSSIALMESSLKVIQKLKVAFMEFYFFKKLLFYSLPFCLHCLAYWFADTYGRLVVATKLSLSANGYYAIALNFGSIIGFLIICLNMGWQEISFAKTLNKDQSTEFYSKACNEYLKFLLLGTIVILPLINLIFPILVGAKFHRSLVYIPMTLFGSIVFGFSQFLTNIINAINKNKFLFICTAAGAIINVTILTLFIGKFGILTAVSSTIISYTFVCIVMIALINKTFKISINLKKLTYFVTFFCVQGYIMTKFGYIINIVAFCVSMTIFIFCYHKELKMITDKIFQKFI